jgi:diketogulonate reductase-like aldo/keto reductase
MLLQTLLLASLLSFSLLCTATQPDPTRVTLDSRYSISNLHPVTIFLQHSSFEFLPPPSASTSEQVYSHCHATCASRGVPEPFLSHCAGLLLGKSLSSDPSNQAIEPQLLPSETSTQFHVELPSQIPLRILEEAGVAVLPGALLPSFAEQLRSVITSRPEYALAVEESKTLSTRARYLQPLCERAPLPCKSWGDGAFLDLVTNPSVTESVSRILGPDFIVDNTAISVTWPGHNTFGPHVDRPFDGNSKHSTTSDRVPPRNYPISVQVVFLLDDFTASNGAFFVSNTTDMAAYTEGLYPTDGSVSLVTGAAGSAIIANGAIVHGAAANFSPRPRIAVLVQYVRSFVRPLHSYSALSAEVGRRNPQQREELERLLNVEGEEPRQVGARFSGDFSMPKLAFGTGSSFTSLSYQETVTAILAALAMGYRHFDLAEIYGNQAAVGEAFQLAFAAGLRREDLFVTSKVWTTNLNHVRESVDAMLREIGVEYLDLLLVHWPVPMEREGEGVGEGCSYAKSYGLSDAWLQMEEEVYGGRVRFLGCSNCNPTTLQQLSSVGRVPVSVNQVEGHMALRQSKIVEFGSKLGVRTVFYGVFGGDVVALLASGTVNDMAAERGCSAGQLLMQWGLEQAGGGIVVSAKGEGRMRENLAVEEGAGGVCGLLGEEGRTELERRVGLAQETRFYCLECFEFLYI